MENSTADNPFADHRRQWRDNLYVYPVISRRAKGLSVGINLNLDKRCNFSCLYCQVDRTGRATLPAVDLQRLGDELRAILHEATAGALWQDPRFAAAPSAMRRINDIAFSGDGEPTSLGDFDQAVEIAAKVKADLGLADVKLVVITNASQLHSPQVQRALPILDANNGEVWAKLDAGSDALFQCINNPYPKVTLRRILENILAVSRQRPVVIQSLFFRMDNADPPREELAAYCRNLRDILAGGGKIKLVQVHTIARPPASKHVQALPNDALDAIAAQIQAAVGAIPVETYYAR